MKKAIGILQIVSGAALLAAGVLTIVEGSARRSARVRAWKGSSFLSREDAALWERLSRFWADVARQDAAALREWFAPEAEVCIGTARTSASRRRNTFGPSL
ncbi:MAG: hypothetical protein ACLRWQ_13860 [Flavonifractor plautii]